MNGEISGKKIQNMDIMEVRKTNTNTGLFLRSNIFFVNHVGFLLACWRIVID